MEKRSAFNVFSYFFVKIQQGRIWEIHKNHIRLKQVEIHTHFVCVCMCVCCGERWGERVWEQGKMKFLHHFMQHTFEVNMFSCILSVTSQLMSEEGLVFKALSPLQIKLVYCLFQLSLIS